MRRQEFQRCDFDRVVFDFASNFDFEIVKRPDGRKRLAVAFRVELQELVATASSSV